MASLTVTALTQRVFTDAEQMMANKRVTKASDLLTLMPSLMRLTYDAHNLCNTTDLSTVMTNVMQMIADKYISDASEQELLMSVIAPAIADVVEGIQLLHVSPSFKASLRKSFRCCWGSKVTKPLPK